MRRVHYIGLDMATIAGVAKWVPELNIAMVDEVKGTPNHQLQYIINAVLPPKKMQVESVFAMEMPTHFQNATTTRSLLERYGFIKHSLLGFGYKVREPNLNSARHWLGARDKKAVLTQLSVYFEGGMLTDNHTDSLLIAMYQAEKDGFAIDWSSVKILQGEFI